MDAQYETRAAEVVRIITFWQTKEDLKGFHPHRATLGCTTAGDLARAEFLVTEVLTNHMFKWISAGHAQSRGLLYFCEFASTHWEMPEDDDVHIGKKCAHAQQLALRSFHVIHFFGTGKVLPDANVMQMYADIVEMWEAKSKTGNKSVFAILGQALAASAFWNTKFESGYKKALSNKHYLPNLMKAIASLKKKCGRTPGKIQRSC